MKRFIPCALLILPAALMGLSCASSSDTSAGQAFPRTAVTAAKRTNTAVGANNAAQSNLEKFRALHPPAPQKGF